MAASKTLNFSYGNLGRDGHLIFTFDGEDIPGLYKDSFPVVWRAANLQAQGAYAFSVTFGSEFVIATCNIVNDKVVLGATTPVQGNILEWTNTTDKAEQVAICVQGPAGMPQPLFYFRDVPVQGTIRLRFTGRLRIYAADYSLEESMVLRREVTSHRLWDHYIGDPGLAKDWGITYNMATGNYEITARE